tara:strand:+ start:561 stop:830 length:270 start_codon:yes stop_codon:yes gene_type:complete
MELKITRQRNEANEISINMDMMINNMEYHLTGYVNFQSYDGEIEITRQDELGREVYNYKDLYDFCEELGYDYEELKDYIIDNTDNKITN